MILKEAEENLRSSLISWGKTHRRTFPWRGTRDPYQILVAEVLLHRTRAAQVTQVYVDVLERYPDLSALGAAHLDELALLLRKLGLAWRVPLLLSCIQVIVSEYGGKVPRDRETLERLPGVGPYIAGAVRCFAFGEADALLDTNTVRIAGRVFGVAVTDASRRSSRFRLMLRSMIDPTEPESSNYALLDLGALVCHPIAPKCYDCPLRPYCAYNRARPETEIHNA